MSISQGEVRKIARLAKLRLSDDELVLYQGQLIKILDSMAELSRLDTSATAPTASAGTRSGAWREDSPRPFPSPEKLLANAPMREGAYFKVKKVIE